ncbi:glycosyltransferase family 4 protein [Flavobacterium sp. P4023]|uniref:Glycosyltransferase family 4 protein n=1 Tax=Flavobacterium flabelliforme TaxID=2816119 RepID=A0ABS5CPG6_9FLAO|nr:glycosyltransferase [Flavobacterium flabelliforme]MBP4140521.1 glycosyltransferase family 4 protein [Flavobacterium flabelliforme]
MNKRQLLIVSKKIPYPLSQGGAIAQFFFLKKLATIFEVSFCTIVNNENQERNIESLKKEIPQITFFVYKVVEDNSINFSVLNTINQIFDKFKKRLKNKVFNLYSKTNNAPTIISFDSNFCYENEKFLKFFIDLVNNQSFDIIQLEFFETISLLSVIPENIKKVFVHHEIRSKRNSLLSSSNVVYRDYIKNITLVIENSLLNRADSIIVFNEEDKYYLKELKAPVLISPFGIPKQLIVKQEVSPFFNKFIFIGSEFHYPNKEGLEWFLDTIFLPNSNIIDWPIYITGFWDGNFKKKYKNNKNIVFTGYIKNLESVYENSILVGPILSGSGVRTKILEAFANKIPVISTPFASEGLYKTTELLNHIIHFNSSLDFLEVFDKINGKSDFLIDLGNSGFKYFSENFDEEILLEKRLKAYLD